VKPGVTGWAQVRYEYGSTIEDSVEKLQYDLYYVKNHSLFLDLLIMLETVAVVLTGKGARLRPAVFMHKRDALPGRPCWNEACPLR
jgi:hypothetical protein